MATGKTDSQEILQIVFYSPCKFTNFSIPHAHYMAKTSYIKTCIPVYIITMVLWSVMLHSKNKQV